MRFDNSGTATAPASPAKLRFDNTGQAEPMFKLPDFSAPGYWSGVAERGKGLARAGIEGVTLGLAGRGAALLNSQLKDESYQQAWDEQKKMRQDAAAKLDAVNPGTYAMAEAAGSLLPILATGGAAAVPQEANLALRGAGTLAEGAAGGAASAYGHDQDPLKGALGGAAFGSIPLASAAAARVAPAVGRVGGAVKGIPGGPLGIYGGWKIGGTAGDTTKNVMQAMTEGPTGRDILAAAASTPGKLYGGATDGQTGRDLLAELASAPGRLYGWMRGQ